MIHGDLDQQSADSSTRPSLAAISARFLAAQLAGDRREALRIVFEDGLDCGVPLSQLQLDVIQPAQYEIGRLWQSNDITVAQEHLATAISQLALARLYPHLPHDAENGLQVIVACVQGEHHDMGARMTADHLEMAGFDVRLLGADVAADRLASIVRQNPPHLVALSVTMPRHLPAALAAVRAVDAVTDSRVPIALGGYAFSEDPEFARTMKSSTVIACSSVADIVSLARRSLTHGWQG